MPPRMLLAFFATRVHCCLMVSTLSTRIPRSIPAELLSSRSAPNLHCMYSYSSPGVGLVESHKERISNKVFWHSCNSPDGAWVRGDRLVSSEVSLWWKSDSLSSLLPIREGLTEPLSPWLSSCCDSRGTLSFLLLLLGLHYCFLLLENRDLGDSPDILNCSSRHLKHNPEFLTVFYTLPHMNHRS